MAKKNGKKEAWRVVKFALFSASAGIIEAVSFALLNETLNLPYWPCYLTALILSVLWNFTLNRSFTFKSANNVPIAMLKVAAFYCVFTPVTTIGGNFLAENLGVNEYVVLGLTMALNITTEFLYDRFFVFRETLDTNKLAKKQQAKKDQGAENDEPEVEKAQNQNYDETQTQNENKNNLNEEEGKE